MLVFKLSCKLAMCYSGGDGGGGGADIGIKANCGKSARRNIELTLLKVHFRI